MYIVFTLDFFIIIALFYNILLFELLVDNKYSWGFHIFSMITFQFHYKSIIDLLRKILQKLRKLWEQRSGFWAGIDMWEYNAIIIYCKLAGLILCSKTVNSGTGRMCGGKLKQTLAKCMGENVKTWKQRPECAVASATSVWLHCAENFQGPLRASRSNRIVDIFGLNLPEKNWMIKQVSHIFFSFYNLIYV